MAAMSEDEMMADLEKADAMGDNELAQHIVGQIKAARQPQDTHPTWQKVAHYGAKALPVIGGVAGGALAGTAGIPTGPGALATGAAGVGLGAASGRAGQKAIDQYLGYEQPDLPRDVADVGMTGLRDATFATGAGTAMAILAKAAPYVTGPLSNAARSLEQRILTNKVNPFGKGKTIAPEALDEVANRGAYRFFGTPKGAASRVEDMRSDLGGQYRQILSDLEASGIVGSDAQQLAAKLAAGQNGTTLNASVPNVYKSAADMLLKQPTTNGRLSLSQMEELKRSAQGLAKSAYQQRMPSEVGKAHEEVASIMRQATEDEIAQQAANAPGLADQFVPVKQSLGNVIEASNVAREGARAAEKRQMFSLTDKLAAMAELGHSGSPIRAGATMMGSHLLRSRGPSSAAVMLRGASDVAGAFPSLAPQAEYAATALSPIAAERPPMNHWLDELLALIRQKQSPATLADASQQ